MMGRIGESRTTRAAGLLLFGLALSLRLLLPGGYMPVETSRGFVISMCDGVGDDRKVFVEIPRSDDGDTERPHPEQLETCTFASLSTPVIDAQAPTQTMRPAQLFGEIALPPPAAIDRVEPDHLSPPQRGPPALA